MGMMNGMQWNMGHHGMMQQQQMGMGMPGGGMWSKGRGMGMSGVLNSSSGLHRKIQKMSYCCAQAVADQDTTQVLECCL